MENRTHNRIFALVAALVVAMPVAHAMTMKEEPVSAPSGGGGGYGSTPAPSLSTTVNAVDLTMGYDPARTRDQQDVQDPLYATDATLAMTQDLMGAQFGFFRTANGYVNLGGASAASDGASHAVTVRFKPAQGWFTSLVRSSTEVDSGQDLLNLGIDRWQPSSDESFLVRVVGKADTSSLGSTDIACASTRDFDVFGGTVPGMAVNLRSQGAESMAASNPDSHRNEAIELVFRSHQSLSGVSCKYFVHVSMNLRFAFEVRPSSVRNPTSDPGDPGATYTDYIGGIRTQVQVFGRGTQNPSLALDKPVNLLFAPVLPTRWICENLRNAPGGLSDHACIEAGAAEATADQVRFSAWRAQAGNGYFVQAAYVRDAVTKVETHFVADVGTVSASSSLLYMVTENGMVSNPWPA